MYTSILLACIDNFESELDARFSIGCNDLNCVSIGSKLFLSPDTINGELLVNDEFIYLLISCLRQNPLLK